jgi:ribosomal protein L12E/L44/L45/RPP1/RPP2
LTEDRAMSDGKQIATHDGRRDMATASVDSARGMLAMIAEAARDPSVDANKMVTLAKLATDMQDRERQAEFNRDKIEAIRNMPAIYKRGHNTHMGNRYAKFEDLHRAVMPVLSRHHLTLDFRIGSEGRDITVQPVLRHDNGYIEEGGVMKGPPDDVNKGRTAIQAVGSASSYLKRYAIKAILNIIEDGEDDDGQGGRVDRQLNDRQIAMTNDAQAAKDEGRYDAFFKALSPKDRAWMISTGRHALLGGAAALPSAAMAEDSKPPEAAQTGKQTAEQWLADFKSWVAECHSRDDLEGLETRHAKALAKLRREGDGALGKEADIAIRDRRIDIDADSNSEGGPADSQRGEGQTLFGED